MDDLVREYRLCENASRKNKLFMEIANEYMPLIHKKLLTVRHIDKQDVLQIYYKRVLIAIADWNGTASFKTYLYSSAVRGVIDEYLTKIIKEIKKDKGRHIYVDDIDSDEYNLNIAHPKIYD